MFQLVVRGFRNDSLFQMVMALKKIKCMFNNEKCFFVCVYVTWN